VASWNIYVPRESGNTMPRSLASQSRRSESQRGRETRLDERRSEERGSFVAGREGSIFLPAILWSMFSSSNVVSMNRKKRNRERER